MKNNKMTREEKRRLLLNKKYEIGYSLHNETETAPAAAGAAEGVLSKVGALTKKQLRAIIAVIVAIAVVLPGLIVGMHVLGAERKVYFTELSSTNPEEDTPLTNTYNGGTVYYYYQKDDRTYTYILGDTVLVPGDKITFNDTTKSITWKHHGADSVPSGAICIAPDLMTLDENASSDGVFVFDLNPNKALEPGKTYYYNAGTSLYSFEVNEFVGYKDSGVAATSDQTARNYYMQDPLEDSEDIQLTIDATNPESVTATISGTQLTRHTVYVQVDELSDGIYLITKKTGNAPEVMVKYATNKNNSNIFDDYNCDTFEDNWGSSSDHPHSVYDISNSNVNIKVASADEIGTFVYSDNQIVINEGDKYIDLADQASSSFLDSCPGVLPEFQAQATGLTGNNLNGTYYLAAYDGAANSSSKGKYTTNKVLGSIYNDSSNYYQNAFVYDLCTEETYTTSWGQRTYYHHNYGSTWTYSNSQLQNYAFELGSSQYYFLGAYNGQNGLSRVANSTAAGETNLYRMQNIYNQKAIDDECSVIVDNDSSGELPAEDVTYTDSTTDQGNGLNIDKTVSGSNGRYKVELEAYTTGSSLNQPATDIVLVLDQSKYMSDDIMFKRDYENLNTYTEFSDIDLNSITHDQLFDNDTDFDQSGGLLSWLATKLASLFRDRKYIHNKYIEDPHHPGQYVYLYQKYYGELKIAQFTYINHYQYYFTDCDGIEYESKEYTQKVTETLTDSDGVTQLEFHIKNDPNEVNDTIIKEMYYITDMFGKSNNTASTLNSSLKTKADAGNLYMKDADGTFRKVFVTESGGMYTYYVTDNDRANGTRVYEATQGGKTQLVGDYSSYKAGIYGVFQGFREYTRKANGDLALDPNNNNYLSKSLYEYKGTNAVSVTAEQVMKEALEEFLLNAHEQALAKNADVHVALVVYAHGAEVKYTLQDGASNKTNMKKPIGTNSVDSMVSAIYNYDCTADGLVNGNKATYASETDQGMGKAYTEMKTYKHDKSKVINGSTVVTPSRKYTLLFTAGVPAAYDSYWLFGTRDISGTYTTSTATGAIDSAYKLKNELNSTVYSVGLFDNANETKINGSKWYYQWSSTVSCSGEVGSYWGGSWVSSALNYNIDPKDAYATNRMLAYISSDYLSPKTIGLNRGWYHPGKTGLFSGFAGGYGYQITNNYTRNELGYYLSVSPKNLNEDVEDENNAQTELSATEVQTILSDIFKKLDMATAVPNSVLDDKAYLVDGITKYFDFDGDTIADVTAEVRYEDGSIDTELTSRLTKTLSDDKKTVTVKGFSYKDHFIPDEDSTEVCDSPRKLVVSFYIERTDGLIGGNNIPTNLSESAIYDGDPKAMAEIDSQGNPISPYGIQVERFEIPRVDLSIEMEHVAKNQSAYYGCEQNLSELVDVTDLTPAEDSEIIPNEFVNIEYTFYEASDTEKEHPINTYTIPAGGTSGVWSNPIQAEGTGEGQNYQPGAVSQDNLNSIFQQMYNTTDYVVDCTVKPVTKGKILDTPIVDDNDNIATVYVFKPHYDVHNDEVENAGDLYPLNSVPDLSWIGYDATGNKLTGSTKTEAEELLEPKTEPSIAYNIFDERLNTVAMDSTSTASYPIEAKTDFQMQNLVLTPTSIEYEVEQLVAEIQYVNSGVIYSMTLFDANGDVEKTIFYDADGKEMEGATTGRQLGTFVDEEGNTQDEELVQEKEKVFGNVTKTLQRTTNPSELTYQGDNPTVTFMNTSSGDGRTNGEFTISLKSHDVTINNQTTGDPTTDYSDPSKLFPLTFTLTDGNTPVANETITYIDANGQTRTTPPTDDNGRFTISMKHDDTITLKEIRDGYKLSITSTPAPGDAYTFAAQVKLGNETTVLDVPEETEKTPDVVISDTAEFDLIHHIGQIPVTGFFDNDESNYGILIAILALLAVSGGGFGVYRVHRPKKENE